MSSRGRHLIGLALANIEIPEDLFYSSEDETSSFCSSRRAESAGNRGGMRYGDILCSSTPTYMQNFDKIRTTSRSTSPTNFTVLQNLNPTEFAGNQGGIHYDDTLCSSTPTYMQNIDEIPIISTSTPPTNFTFVQNFNPTESARNHDGMLYSDTSYNLPYMQSTSIDEIPMSWKSTSPTTFISLPSLYPMPMDIEIQNTEELHTSQLQNSTAQSLNFRESQISNICVDSTKWEVSSNTDDTGNYINSSSKLIDIQLPSSNKVLDELSDLEVSSTTTIEQNSCLQSPTTSKYTKKGLLRKRKTFDVSVSERKIKKQKSFAAKHGVKNPCDPKKCRRLCHTKISEYQRKFLNEEFWKLTSKERSSFILHHVSSCTPKRRTTHLARLDPDTDKKFQRNKSLSFILKDNSGTSHNVCRSFFLTTLGFHDNNDRVLRTALKNCENSVSPPSDTRCTKPPHNKIDNRLILNHIESFNPQISHYRREHAPFRLYLPSDLNLTDMYKDFLEQKTNLGCSYATYRNAAKQMNISFANLGKEECEICEAFKLHNSAHTREQLDEECEVCIKWRGHHTRYELARQEYKEDATRIPDTDEVIYCADLQKVIMLPRLEMFKRAIFVNRLTAYNESFVPVGELQLNAGPYAVLWHEAITGRTKDEIISTFYSFLKQKYNFKKIVLWLDNCSAQNKNWAFLSFLIYMVNSNEILAEKITIRYFEPGHTFMAADSFHHLVEHSMKKKKKLYDFADFVEAVQNAKKQTAVCSMKLEDFFIWTDYTSQYKLNQINPRPYLQDMVEIVVTRGSYNLSYKTAFNAEFNDVNFLTPQHTKKKTLPSPKMRKEYAGFNLRKKNMLISQLGDIIPRNKLEFWEKLPTN